MSTNSDMVSWRNSVERPTMNDNMKRYAFHILHIESNFMRNNSLCKYNRRTRHRITPYYVPGGRLVLVENEKLPMRTHTKSENSDTGNESEDCEPLVSPVGLFKSKSLENINSSSHNFNFTHDFLIELENRKNTGDSSDVELVSSKMKCLNV